jgi:hypothetical protein
MCPPHEPQNDDSNQEHVSQTHEIRYLAKYSSYDLWLAVPKPSPSPPNPERSVVQLQFKDLQPPHNVTLSVREFEAFHDALSRLMEYVRREYEVRE